MTDPRKIAEDIEAGGGATVEQRRTLARAYLEMAAALPFARAPHAFKRIVANAVKGALRDRGGTITKDDAGLLTERIYSRALAGMRGEHGHEEELSPIPSTPNASVDEERESGTPAQAPASGQDSARAGLRVDVEKAYLALLPPAGAWSHDEGDVVLTHPDGSTERFYAGERAPFIVAACSRYEALGGAADRLRRTGGPWFEGIPDSDRDAAYADWLAARAEEEERG